MIFLFLFKNKNKNSKNFGVYNLWEEKIKAKIGFSFN